MYKFMSTVFDTVYHVYLRLVYLRLRYSVVLVFYVEGIPFYVPKDANARKKMFQDGWLAFALGERVYGRSRRVLKNNRVVKHELEHVRQYRENPAVFTVAYMIENYLLGYAANSFEIAARRAERSRRVIHRVWLSR
jgi:hypothetical protein